MSTTPTTPAPEADTETEAAAAPAPVNTGRTMPGAGRMSRPPKVRHVAFTPSETEPVSVFPVGARVAHDTFGKGDVTAVDGLKLTIEFEAGPKKVMDSFVTKA